MLTQPISKLYTPQDLLEMPDNSTLELVDGRIVEKNVSIESSKIEGLFYFRIQAFLSQNPVADVYPASLGYRCFPDDPGKVRKPDTTVVSLSRLNALPDPNSGYMPIPPDLAIEVISPNDVTYETDDKVREYLQAGFPLVWVADPNSRTITVYPRQGRPAIFSDDDEMTAEAVLPGFRCKVSDFFPAKSA
jgi:Uma2 family endonuclease